MYNLCHFFFQEASHLQSVNTLPADMEDKECLLLTVCLSSPGLVASSSHHWKAPTVESATTKSRIYNALVAWFLSLVNIYLTSPWQRHSTEIIWLFVLSLRWSPCFTEASNLLGWSTRPSRWWWQGCCTFLGGWPTAAVDRGWTGSTHLCCVPRRGPTTCPKTPGERNEHRDPFKLLIISSSSILIPNSMWMHPNISSVPTPPFLQLSDFPFSSL